MRLHICILLFSLVLGLNSCKKDFLDVKDDSVVLAEQYVTDLNTTQHYLNGIYVVLGKDFFHGYNQVYPDLIADNIKLAPGKSVLLNQYKWLQSSSGTANMNTVWQWGYQLARSCSFVIENAIKFGTQDPAKANQIQAEAYSIRALVHFVMVNIFAQSYNYSSGGAHLGIPYVKTFDWTQPVNRNSVSEVYAAMINDLSQAITLYSKANIDNTLAMNTMAAKALLARIYLFKEDWPQAKNLATEVANAIPLMTGSSYPSKLFTLQESEALFQLAPSSTSVITGSYNTFFQGRLFNNKSASLFLATTEIANLLRQNPQDIRKSWVKSGGTGKDTIVKFPINIVAGFNPTSGSYYHTILRSSEMFLTVAEAAAQTGDENTARTYLDAIRKRADVTTASSTASGVALLDSIHLERRKELAFEGLRIFDLQRWKKNVMRLDPVTPDVALLPYPNNKAIAPIPFIDTQTGIQQNPSY